MDWLTFIATIVGHIVWPFVIIVLLVVLRKHVVAVADRIEELTIGGTTVRLSKLLKTNAEIIEHATHVDNPNPSDISRSDSISNEIASSPKDLSSPALVRHRTRDSAEKIGNLQGLELWKSTAIGQIISGYEELDNALLEIGDTIGIDAARGSSVMHVLVQHGAIDKDTAALFGTIHDARNLVAHAQALPSEREALEYVRQVAYLKAILCNLLQKIEKGEVKL